MPAMTQSFEFYQAHNRSVRLQRHVTALKEILNDLEKDLKDAKAEKIHYCNHGETRLVKDFNDPTQKETKECVSCHKTLMDEVQMIDAEFEET